MSTELVNPLDKDIAKVFVSEEDIQKRVAELADQISKDYKDEQLIIVSVLKGAIYFVSDLTRQLKLDFTMDFMCVSSYGNQMDSSGVVRILKDLDEDIAGKNILVVEDILDTGLTLKYLLRNFAARGAKSIEVASLLVKARERTEPINCKYTGFTIPNEFVVGYGLDYAERYRGLPYIGVLKPEVYSI